MPFRFHFESPRGFGHRGARWAAFARAFSDEFGGGFGGDWGQADRPRPRPRRFGAEALRILLLQLLKDEPRHGYELIKAIEAMSAGLYSPSPGMIYPTLTLLADQGLIAEQPGEEGRRRYAITEAGLAALEAANDQLKDVLARLAELAGAVREDETRPLRRAFRNLKAAAGQRMAADGDANDSGRELALKIAEILDEAAQRIERL